MHKKVAEVYGEGEVRGLLAAIDEAIGDRLIPAPQDVEEDTGAGLLLSQIRVMNWGELATAVASRRDGGGKLIATCAVASFVFGKDYTARLTVHLTRSVAPGAKWLMSFSREIRGNNWLGFVEHQARFMTAMGLDEGQKLEMDDRKALAVVGELTDRLR